MKKEEFSFPPDIRKVRITDPFFAAEGELIRREVIPYQWDALNDRIPGADKSYCMRNFREAGKLMRKKHADPGYLPPAYSYRGFNILPEEGKEPEEGRFYGFLFQDSDFYKWIEAVGYTLMQHPDPELEACADAAIGIVCDAQADNGYLDTYYILSGMERAFTDLQNHHELYCLGHLIEGAISYYRATGKDRLLKAAGRFADYVSGIFGDGEGKLRGYPGHEIAEMALASLYELTGEKRYLELAEFFINERGRKPYIFDLQAGERAAYEKREYRPDTRPERYDYYQATKPVREQTEAVGHAVRAVYLYSGMADVARLTGDESLYRACRRLWDSIVSEKLYITGGIGATQEGEAFSQIYDLPNDTAYSETCAAIGLVFFARRLLQIRPEAGIADVMERALYNTVLAGMAMDGKSFFYVNPLEVVPFDAKRDKRKAHVKTTRQKWFGCACCPPNIARTVSNVASYAFTASADTLFVHLYIGAEIGCRLAGKDCRIRIESGFPNEGKVRILPMGEVPAAARIALRIPSWCEDPMADGMRPEACKDAYRDGYLYLAADREHELMLPMVPRAVRARTAVSEDIGKLAFIRGPFTYCAEWIDNLPEEGRRKTEEEFDGSELAGLIVDPESIKNGIRECRIRIGETELTALEVDGYREEKENGASVISPLYTVFGPETEKNAGERRKTVIRLIPYHAWANRGEGEMRVWLRHG